LCFNDVSNSGELYRTWFISQAKAWYRQSVEVWEQQHPDNEEDAVCFTEAMTHLQDADVATAALTEGPWKESTDGPSKPADRSWSVREEAGSSMNKFQNTTDDGRTAAA
jgi:hypothetical protein